jgi:hypothetical protein
MVTFSDRSDTESLRGRAESLVGTASTLAKSLHGRLAVHYTELFQVSESDWNFLVTAAALYVASLRLYDEIPTERFGGLYEIVQETLPPGTQQAMASCGKFVTERAGAESDPFTFDTVLGYWVLWNALPDRPSKDQAELAFYIGHSLTDGLLSWWQG